MRLSRSLRRAAAVSVVAALAVPAVASAHPGVYTVTQKLANGTETYAQDPTGAHLTDKTQYAIANDGYAIGLTESNGLTGVQADGTAGMLNYKAMPGTWRAPMTPEQKRSFGPAQTDVQAHATCTNSTLLDTPANVLAWQQRSDNDPFYNYIPWQKASAGVGDDPSTWIAVVKRVTGVDLSTLSSTADFKAACETAPASGTYHAADASASITTAMIAEAQAPLQTQVGTLQSQVAQMQNQVSTLQAAKAASDAVAQTLVNRPLALTLSAKRFDQPIAMVTGAAGTAVTVRVLLSSSGAKQLKVSRTIATKSKTLGAQGAELLTLSLTKTAAKAIKKHGRAMKVTVQAVGGARTDTASGTLNG
jgi:hypothetical protein